MNTNGTTCEKKEKNGKKRAKKAVIIIVSIMLILLSAAAMGVVYMDSKLNLITYDNQEEEWIVATDSDVVSDTDEFEIIEEDVEIILPEDVIYKDKNVVNILLLGTDERSDKFSNSARSDAMLLVSLNKNTNKIKLVSLERGMAVKMPNGKVDYLTHAFHYGGPKWVLSCVQSHLGVDVEKYIRVNFNVFEKLVDSIGGVDIELTEMEALALNHKVKTNTYKLDRKVSVGMNHLDGFEALQYCRLRYIDSDWKRIERQRKTISAIQGQCRNLSLTELDEAANSILPMVQTNLDKSEIVSLLVSIPKFLDSDIEDMTIPAKGTFTSLSKVDFKENSRILHDFFYGDDTESN